MNALLLSALTTSPITDHTKAESGPVPWRVRFEPDSKLGQEAIEFETFPVLIGRTTQLSDDTQPDLTLAAKRLSRRHAQLFVRDGVLYVEDLGSTNGTHVNGKALAQGDERSLQHGDRIAFGSKDFAFTVCLSPISESAEVDSEVAGGTVYINSGDDFLSLFCSRAATGVHTFGQLPQTVKPTKKRGFLKEFRGALRDDKAKSGRDWMWFMVIWVGVAVLAGGVYWHGAQERELRTLLEHEQYTQALGSAYQYLQQRPDDYVLNELALEALVKKVVPQWMGALRRIAYNDAERGLADVSLRYPLTPDGTAMLELLRWITELERFFHLRGGAEAPIVLFRDENGIEALLNWWTREASAQQHLLLTIVRFIPEFESVHVRTISRLRQLQSEQSLYLSAITQFKQLLDDKLAAGDIDGLMTDLEDFRQKYRKIQGLDDLRTDLESFAALRSAVQDRDPEAALALSGRPYRTQPIRQFATQWANEQLPPQSVLMDYEVVHQSWRSGMIEHAIELLEPLTQQPWGEVAEALLARYQQIRNDFTALQEQSGQPGYGERLLAFYARLEPRDDAYYRQQLAEEFQFTRDRILVSAGEDLDAARSAWSAYLEAGGIGGLLRLEEKVPERYSRQSERLNAASTKIERAAQRYVLAQADWPAPAQELQKAIRNEIQQQRRALEELRLVVPASQVEAKLALLPLTPETP